MRPLAAFVILAGLSSSGCKDNKTTPPAPPPATPPAAQPARTTTAPPKPLELTEVQKKVIGKWESDNRFARYKMEFSPYGSFIGTLKINEEPESDIWPSTRPTFRFLDDNTLEITVGGIGPDKETWKIVRVTDTDLDVDTGHIVIKLKRVK